MEAHARGLTTCIDTTGQGLKHSREWWGVLYEAVALRPCMVSHFCTW